MSASVPNAGRADTGGEGARRALRHRLVGPSRIPLPAAIFFLMTSKKRRAPMPVTRRTGERSHRGRVRLWRWRRNPLRRRGDIIEAWVILAVWAVVLVGSTVAAVTTFRAADAMYARQRAERHPVSAVLVTDASSVAGDEDASGDKVPAKVRWTVPGGSSRTDKTLVDAGQTAGTRVTVWADARNRLVTEPPTSAEAVFEAALLGGAAALALACAAIGAGAAARHGLAQRRIDSWGAAWELADPRWGHRTG